MSQRRFLFLFGLLLGGYLFCYAAWAASPETPLGHDFLSYWRAAIDSYYGDSPYRADVTGGTVDWTGAGPYRYPPPFAPLAVPFLLLDFRPAAFLWGLGQFAAWSLALALLWDLLGRPTGRRALLIGGALIAGVPTWSGIIEGNISLSLGALLVLGLWFERRGNELRSGAAYAFAAAWKLTPAILLLGLLLARRQRAILGAALFLLLLCLITLPFDSVRLGWVDYLSYPLRALTGSDGAARWNFGAASITASVLGPGWLTPLSLTVAGIAVLLVAPVTRRLAGIERWSALVLLATLGSPTIWPHSLALVGLAVAPLAMRSRHPYWHLAAWLLTMLVFSVQITLLVWIALLPAFYELWSASRVRNSGDERLTDTAADRRSGG